MELLILLIVVALVASVILGPIGCFKSFAVGSAVGKLERDMDRLAVQLRDAQEICRALQAQLRANTDDPAEIVEQQEAASVESPEQLPEPEPEAQAEATEARQVVEDQPTTLERLRALRHEQDAHEPIASIDDDTAAAQEDETLDALPETIEDAGKNGPAWDRRPALHHGEAGKIDSMGLTLTTDETPAPPSQTGSEANEPTRRLTIEEVLAGKVFVWIGAIALVLTAAFLLKLGFDENIITIPVRVIGAGVFGIALWCVGEWARNRVSLIAQALCGSGVAVLYGTIIAARHYNLLGGSSTIAFGLMGLVTAAAVVLSLRHGPAVAILGMLGGFMLPPLLVKDFGPNAGMILYLLAIEIGVLAVTGKRGWFGISAMTLFFTIAWSLGYTLIGDHPHERTLTAMLILGTAAAYLWHTARIHRDPDASPALRKRVLTLSTTATCSAIAITALLVVEGGYTFRDMGMLWLVALGTLVLARLDARQLAMPFIAMGLSLLVLIADAARSITTGPSDMLIQMSACFGGLFLLGGYTCLWANKHRKVFATMCAIAGPSFYGLIFFAGHEVYGLRDFWWPYTLTLAGVYALATLPMLLRRKAEHDWSIALFSVLSFALVCVTLGQAMDHPRFAVCLALVSAVVALIDLRLFIRPLRVAACVVAFVSVAPLVMPGPFELTIKGGPVFNTLLPIYALPALAYGIIAWCAARAGSRETAKHLTWLCIATTTGMLLVLIRDIYQPGDFKAEAFHLYEWSTYATVLLIAAYLGTWLARRLSFKPIQHASICVASIGGAIALIAGVAVGNPLFNGDGIGGWELALGLFALYIVPAALIWYWSGRAVLSEQPQLIAALRGIAIILTAIFAGLQIRNGFQPDNLRAVGVGLYECVTYAAIAILMGGFIQQLDRHVFKDTVIRLAGRAIFAIGVAVTLIGSVLVYNPIFDDNAVGGWALLGPLAVLYVVPAVLLWLWSRGKTLADQPGWVSLLRGIAIAFVAVFVVQLIRNSFHANDLRALSVGAFECATYGLAWVGLGFLFHLIAPRCTLPKTTGAVGRSIFGIGLATLIIGNVIALNPLWFREYLGYLPVFNGLWYLFGPTILILALLARHTRRTGQKTPAKLAGFLAIGLSFMLLSTFVRHGFSGDGLAIITGKLDSAERYAYSLVWVVFGGVLLVAGVFTKLDTLRYGSLAILLLAVGKVFLIDTANLDNLYRVFSFFGLGVTLIGLGYLYQRLVFKRPVNPKDLRASP